MADYIYLLETRLSKAQRSALDAVREVARAKSTMLFLVGGAVRDLTSGSPVRDLDVVVQGNALKMKKELEKAGAVLVGENDPGQALYLSFPGSVRMEVGSTLSATYPKPGKPVLRPASLLDDLRRRDFTANAMALSLNEGSYGLLMDPLNGVADIENRELRLTSNYGFIEDPARMIRAARLMARLGWTMEEKTQARYETGKQEGYISALSSFHRGYETEEIFHEEDPLRVMRRLEEEGWMPSLFPPLSVARANLPELERLRETQTQLQLQGIATDASAANFPLLTGKLSAAELRELKGLFPRQGFVTQIDELDAEAKEFAAQLLSKAAALPSQAFQLIHRARPEAVLWAAHTSKSGALQNKMKSFYAEWPLAKQKIPYILMQEMRIVPELSTYDQVVESLFYALMDGRLATIEEMKAFLEPHSPPAPPPPVHLRRQRATKKDAKAAKGRKKVLASVDPDDEEDDSDQEETPGNEDRDDSEGSTEDNADDVTETEAEELEEIEPAVEVAAKKPVSPRQQTPSAEAMSQPAATGPTLVAKAAAPAKTSGSAVSSEKPKDLGSKSKPAAPVKAAPAPKTAAHGRPAQPGARASTAPVKAGRSVPSAPSVKKAPFPAGKPALVAAVRPTSVQKTTAKAVTKSASAAGKTTKKSVPVPAKPGAKKARPAPTRKSPPAKAVPPAKKSKPKTAPPPAKKATKKVR